MSDENEHPSRSELLRATAIRALRPVAHKLWSLGLRPTPHTKWIYSSIYKAHWFSREFYEWGHSALVATPIFLSQCSKYGENIVADRIPYITGPVNLELGSNIRFGGKFEIYPSTHAIKPTVKIDDNVFIGHGVTIAVGKRVEIGRLTSISEGTHIADTEGHAQRDSEQPIWEIPAGDDDIAPVIIEEKVQIGNGCKILKGVRIGARSVIGAGSVVRANIPPDSVAMGNPARVVKRLVPTTQEAEKGSSKLTS